MVNSGTGAKAGGRVGIVGTGHRARVRALFDCVLSFSTFSPHASLDFIRIVIHPMPVSLNHQSKYRSSQLGIAYMRNAQLTFSSTPPPFPPGPRLPS